MKTTLALLSLFCTSTVAATFAAEFAGVSLPSRFDYTHAFLAFAIAVIVMTAFADYARPQRGRSPSHGETENGAMLTPAGAKSEHPLAA